MVNLLTVDLEEWFVVEALRASFPASRWHELPSTVERNTHLILNMFARRHARATWFLLGWCAERFPDLMKIIVSEGHEIACHSYFHHRVDQLTEEEFRADTIRAIEAISAASGIRPLGYRAPSWSINQTIPWAFDVLAELGFSYDSSLFPIKHDIYGIPDGPRSMFKMQTRSGKPLFELPASTVRLWGQNIPVTGGGYLRHSPYWYSRRMVQSLNREQLPAVVYLHPWEFDPNPPKVAGLSSLQRIRTYGSTSTFSMKVDHLLQDFEFTTMAGYIGSLTKRPIGFERP